MSISRTIIISCAGMGNRLGLNTTKALLNIEGKPLIIRHLEMLKNETDIRIVIGYQSENIIDVVSTYRKDVIFVFNHEYQSTGTGASVCKAIPYANEFILSLDGDLLVHPSDMNKILNHEGEFVGGTDISSDDPWMLQTQMQENRTMVHGFSRTEGLYEWTGITQVHHKRVKLGRGHVFQLIEPYLPIRMLYVRTKEIDTINDYEKAVLWVRNNFAK